MAACKQLAQLPSPSPHAHTSAQPLQIRTSCSPSERFSAAEGQLSNSLQISSSVSQMAAASVLTGRTACLPSCSGRAAPVAWPAAPVCSQTRAARQWQPVAGPAAPLLVGAAGFGVARDARRAPPGVAHAALADAPRPTGSEVRVAAL